jgi:hypothetical protein
MTVSSDATQGCRPDRRFHRSDDLRQAVDNFSSARRSQNDQQKLYILLQERYTKLTLQPSELVDRAKMLRWLGKLDSASAQVSGACGSAARRVSAQV